MEKSRSRHPLWLRLIHWLNFYILAILLWSGMLIYWAYPVYKIPVGGRLYPIVPKSWFASLGMEFRLAEGLAYHFYFMWVLLLSGLAYLVLSFSTGHWRTLWTSVPELKKIPGWIFSRRKKQDDSDGGYNPVQKLVYFGTIWVLVLLVFSGLAIYKPARLSGLTWILGGYAMARAIHFGCTVYLVFFFLVHVLQVIRAGWKNFTSMIFGGS